MRACFSRYILRCWQRSIVSFSVKSHISSLASCLNKFLQFQHPSSLSLRQVALRSDAHHQEIHWKLVYWEASIPPRSTMCRERSCHGQCSGGASLSRKAMEKTIEAQKEFQQKIVFQTRIQGFDCNFVGGCECCISTIHLFNCRCYGRPSPQPHYFYFTCFYFWHWYCFTPSRITPERGVVGGFVVI